MRCWLALACALPCLGASPTAPPALVQETLPSGLRVSIFADPSMPVVATQVWVHVGSADEGPGEKGLAHLFEHLMFGPTQTRDGRDYSEYHHRYGGEENAYTDPDETVYVSAIEPQHHDGVLQREADRLGRLIVDRAALANEQKVVTEELRLRLENDPMGRAFTAALSILGNHPYAHPTAGTKEDIAAATVESARSFYAAHYRPDNTHLVIVGPVDPESTLDDVRREFAYLEGGTPPRRDIPPVMDADLTEESTLRVDLPPVEIALVGFPLPPADSEDYWPLRVLQQMLTGGAVDPLREDLVVKRGKAVEAGVESLLQRRGGAFIFYSAHLPYRRQKTAFRQIEKSRRALAEESEWRSEAAVEAAKRALRRDELAAAWFAEARAESIGRAEWWQGDARLGLQGDARIQAVTRERVEEVWRRYVAEADPVRLYMKPEDVPLLVRLFGWVYPLVSR